MDGQNLAIKDLSVAFIYVADRDAIVERHEKGVGIPVKTRTLSASVYDRFKFKRRMALQLPEYISSVEQRSQNRTTKTP